MALPTTTTQNTVITALVDALLALTADDENGLYGKLVLSAPISLAKHQEDHVAVIDIPDGDESWYGIGNHRRTEEYTVAMHATAFRYGADETAMRDARAAVYAMFNAVAAYIRDNPSLGGVTIQQMSGTTLEQHFTTDERVAQLRWGVGLRAQIEVV